MLSWVMRKIGAQLRHRSTLFTSTLLSRSEFVDPHRLETSHYKPTTRPVQYVVVRHHRGVAFAPAMRCDWSVAFRSTRMWGCRLLR